MTEWLIVVDCKSVGFSIVGSNPTLFLFILMKFKAKMIQRHPFHLVDPSPWPLVAALGGLSLTFGGVLFMHNYKGCLLYTSPSPRDRTRSRMPSSA